MERVGLGAVMQVRASFRAGWAIATPGKGQSRECSQVAPQILEPAHCLGQDVRIYGENKLMLCLMLACSCSRGRTGSGCEMCDRSSMAGETQV